MSIAQHAPLAQVDIEELPPEVVDTLPASVQDKVPDGLLEAASSSSTLTKVLLVIGVIAVAAFVFGVIKSAVKWMIYSAIIGVGAWYFFFQQ